MNLLILVFPPSRWCCAQTPNLRKYVYVYEVTSILHLVRQKALTCRYRRYWMAVNHRGLSQFSSASGSLLYGVKRISPVRGKFDISLDRIFQGMLWGKGFVCWHEKIRKHEAIILGAKPTSLQYFLILNAAALSPKDAQERYKPVFRILSKGTAKIFDVR